MKEKSNQCTHIAHPYPIFAKSKTPSSMPQTIRNTLIPKTITRFRKNVNMSKKSSIFAKSITI
ncbi:MAG: hypothetical protein MJZ45_03805 [Bacteroidales bacterium]|nr:hypothetical protein [Bacteroidales bacterium]